MEKDLILIIKQSLGGEVFIDDSWFTILSTGGSVRKHHHLTEICKINDFEVASQKFALVYYLESGDQSSSQPGILKFYEPDKELLPVNGMVAIFPANRYHSVDYNGIKDRVMIAMNFWII